MSWGDNWKRLETPKRRGLEKGANAAERLNPLGSLNPEEVLMGPGLPLRWTRQRHSAVAVGSLSSYSEAGVASVKKNNRNLQTRTSWKLE